MPRKRKSEKQAQKDKLKAMFPDAIDFMQKALTDTIPTKNNVKQRATVGQKLDIAKIVVDQVIGRPAQGSPMGGDNERPQITTLEVIKSYEGGGLPAETPSDGLIPVEEPAPGPQTRAEWLQSVEEEALGLDQGEMTVINARVNDVLLPTDDLCRASVEGRRCLLERKHAGSCDLAKEPIKAD